MQAEDGQQPGTISHDGVPLPVLSGGRVVAVRSSASFQTEVQKLSEAGQLIG